MGLFERLFGPRRAESAVRGYFQTLTAYSPSFTSRAGGIYEAAETRAAIHTIATHCSKLKPHVTGTRGKQLERVLQIRANPWQNMQQFLYRAATILEVDNICFLVPVLDERDRTVGAYPVLPGSCELVEGLDRQLYLRYRFKNGQTAAVEYARCGVLLKMQYGDDFFPETNAALDGTLDLIDVQNQGIAAGIKNAAAVRFLARLGQSLRSEDIKAEQARFKELNLGADNNGGVMMVDTKYAEVKQLEAKPFVVDAEQMKLIQERVDSYYGVNEKILRNEWDETTWTAFYEGKIEVFALQMSLAMTGMLFSEREQALGGEVTFSANRLQFATLKDKVETIQQLFDRGMLNRDEGREIMQMPPLPNGEGQAYYIRGEYISEAERKAIRGEEKKEETDDEGPGKDA